MFFVPPDEDARRATLTADEQDHNGNCDGGESRCYGHSHAARIAIPNKGGSQCHCWSESDRHSWWRQGGRRKRGREDNWRAHIEPERRQLSREARGDDAPSERTGQAALGHRTHLRHSDRHRQTGESHRVDSNAEAGHAIGNHIRTRGTQIGLRRTRREVVRPLGFQEHCWRRLCHVVRAQDATTLRHNRHITGTHQPRAQAAHDSVEECGSIRRHIHV